MGCVSLVFYLLSFHSLNSGPHSASTYTFSPHSGLIHKHTINSIHPAPHQAAYDAIQSSLERILGLAEPGVSGEVTRVEGGDTR